RCERAATVRERLIALPDGRGSFRGNREVSSLGFHHCGHSFSMKSYLDITDCTECSGCNGCTGLDGRTRKPGKNAMRTWILRWSLSLLAIIGVGTTRLAAQTVVPVAPQIHIVPTVSYEPARPALSPPALIDP